MKYLIIVVFALLLSACTQRSSDAQTPYYTRLDSILADAVSGTADSMATFTVGKLVTSLFITVTNSTVADTIKGRALWYGNDNYKTVSWRNTKNGNVDSVLYIAATAGLPQTWELMDPNINNLQLYSNAGTYSATRRTKVYFKYRK